MNFRNIEISLARKSYIPTLEPLPVISVSVIFIYLHCDSIALSVKKFDSILWIQTGWISLVSGILIDMNTHNQVIEDTVSELKQFSPRSVFVYGSRGRGDFTEDSDYEVGVVFNESAYVERAKIHAAITDPLVKVYPFKWEELENGKLDFLFQKSMYLRELRLGAKLLYGDDVLSAIPELPITTLDLIQRTRFDIGMALAALLSYRSGDMGTAMDEFTKSCLYGLRSLVILESKKFPLGYENIYKLSERLVGDDDCRKVIEAAITYRRTKTIPGIDLIYENISLLDSFIEPRILSEFRGHGVTDLV